MVLPRICYTTPHETSARLQAEPLLSPHQRIASRAFFLTGEERTRLVDRLWRIGWFSGVEVLAYCFMSDHFHQLVYVPEAPKMDDVELLARIFALYSGTRLAEVSIDGKAMTDWFEKIRNKKGTFSLEYGKATSQHGRQLELSKRQIDVADARDMLYAATDFGRAGHRRKGASRMNGNCEHKDAVAQPLG